MKVVYAVLIGVLILLVAFKMYQSSYAISNYDEIRVIGAMKEVMRKNKLEGVFNLQNIPGNGHTYGLGPLENMKGEITVLDGTTFVSRVVNDSEVLVTKNSMVKAPFFVFTEVEHWEEKELPRDIKNAADLENYLGAFYTGSKQPFAFRLKGRVDNAKIHILNLPLGSEVYSHNDAHEGEVRRDIQNDTVDIIGFYSKKHQGIFTHHDLYIHMHLINSSRTLMGHLDELILGSEMQLFLPKKKVEVQ